MQVTDKAVSTNDFENDLGLVNNEELATTATAKTSKESSSSRFDLNLETVLATLIENKVEAIKHQDRKRSSVASSRKNSIVKRLRITSTSTISSGNKDFYNENKGEKNIYTKRWQRMQPTDSCETHSSTNNCGPPSQELSISSIESNRMIRPFKSNLKNSPLTSRQSSRDTTDDNNSLPPFSRQESRESYPSFSRQDSKDSAYSRSAFGRQDSKDSTCRILMKQEQLRTKNPCCCEKGVGLNIQRSFDDDYVSLKIDDELFSDEEALRRARRKRRRKRRRRLRRQLALEAMRGATNLPPKVAPKEDRVKVLDNDDLPPKARWTIVATACVLLFLCLLLVGVTLRMAPLIDDMVRMENEQLINSYNNGAKLNLTLTRSGTTVHIL